MKVNNYISTYDNVINSNICNDIIHLFESCTHQHEKILVDNHFSFTHIQLPMYDEWKYYCLFLEDIFRTYVKKYFIDNKLDEYRFPDQFGFELFKVKKYFPNNVDEFKKHVDVTDYNSARRFLAFFIYLNDNKGGQTFFPDYKIKINPVAGKLLMFPPLWTHLHSGLKPIKNPKYIVGSYLHYV